MNAPRERDLQDIRDVPRRIKEELECFFVASTAFQHKDLRILEWVNSRDARELLMSAAATGGNENGK